MDILRIVDRGNQAAVELDIRPFAVVVDNQVVPEEGNTLVEVALGSLVVLVVDNILVAGPAIDLVGLDHTWEVVAAIDPADLDRTFAVAETVLVQVDGQQSSDELLVEVDHHIHSTSCTSSSSQSTSAFGINNRPDLK